MPDLFLLDDFGLRKRTAQQSSDSYSDSYDVLVERHRRAAEALRTAQALAVPPARSRKDLLRPC